MQDTYNRYKALVEERLVSYIPPVERASGIIQESMKYSLEAGGKRLRPVLLLAACELAGGSAEEALPYACALEFIHTYSLIHDDHPSMDNDDLRRGKPTNHKVFGDDIAILAGDGLLNSAMDIMLEDIIDAGLSEKRLRAMYEISRAAGVRGMVAGQVADVMMTDHRQPIEEAGFKDSEEALLYIHANKTGALIKAAVMAGGHIGGADDQLMRDLEVYGTNIGLVFQIVDDILDIIGDEAQLGKKVGADIELGKLTYPSVYGLDRSYARAEEVTDMACKALENHGEATVFLRKLALDLVKRIS